MKKALFLPLAGFALAAAASCGGCSDSDPVPPPREEKEYSVGDLYDCEGVKGIVYKVSEDRRHGMIVSLEEASSIRWSTIAMYWPEAYDMADGMKNREAVLAYVFGEPLEDGTTFDEYEEKGQNWTTLSPLFSWCETELNADGVEGWYIPSLEELYELYDVYNGGRDEVNETARATFNSYLTDNGGTAFSNVEDAWYWSSTADETIPLVAIAVQFVTGSYIQPGKTSPYYARAVHAF